MTILSPVPPRDLETRPGGGPPAVHTSRRGPASIPDPCSGIAIDLLPGEPLEETYAALVARVCTRRSRSEGVG